MSRSHPERKKSPRAPSIALDEAIERVLRIYEKEKRHAAPTEVVVQDMGYKSANNGAALSVLASIRYYGLLERPQDGKLSVSKEFENYQYAPDEQVKRGLLLKWLRSPQVFADLIDRYPGGFPSDANLRFDLMDRGFSPAAADSVVSVFRRSVEFVGFDGSEAAPVVEPLPQASAVELLGPAAASSNALRPRIEPQHPSPENQNEGDDKIPVRLPGGRKAWLIVPTPFYEADKARLKAQIDLLLAEDRDPLLD
jgi:hypothetical protein